MPRYNKKTYRKKRTYRKKSNFRRRFSRKYGKTRMSRMVSRNAIAPDTAFTKLRYAYLATYTPGLPTPSGTLATNFSNGRLVRGNDIYDPQSTSGVVPATGFNQWCSQTGLYQEFVVHASKIKVEAINLDANAVSIALYPIMENNATITTIDGNEQAYARTAFVGTASGNNRVTLKNFMKTKKMIGVRDLIDDEQSKGSYAASPNALNIWDWALDCVEPSGSATGNLSVKVVVTYYVQFLQRPVVSVSAQ